MVTELVVLIFVLCVNFQKKKEMQKWPSFERKQLQNVPSVKKKKTPKSQRFFYLHNSPEFMKSVSS